MSRSIKKGPFIAHNLLKSVIKNAAIKDKEIIKTWSRSSTILPIMVGYTFGIYNGKKHIPIFKNPYSQSRS